MSEYKSPEGLPTAADVDPRARPARSPNQCDQGSPRFSAHFFANNYCIAAGPIVRLVLGSYFGRSIMPTTTITVRDETITGNSVGAFPLELLTERITVRELIRSRVYQEVQDYNRKTPDYFRG